MYKIICKQLVQPKGIWLICWVLKRLAKQTFFLHPDVLLYELLISASLLLQMLQNLGKADKTTDEDFEGQCLNFNRQQVNPTYIVAL